MNNLSLPSLLVGASLGSGTGTIQDFLKLKLGNVILTSLPDDKELSMEVMRFCREHKIYIMLSEIVQRHNHTRLHCEHLSKSDLEEVIAEASNFFLGRYAIGEAGGMLYWPQSYVIDESAGRYAAMPPCKNEAEAHRVYVEYLRNQLAYERQTVCNCRLFNVESSIAFSYQAEAGIDAQCLEMLPGDPLLALSAIRGTATDKHTLWGVHIAMLWYGGIRMDELWIRRWRIALWTALLSGAQFIYPESGHFEYHERDGKWFEFDSNELLRVRRELRDLYRFSQIHHRPENGPQVTVAVVQGQDDGHPGLWNPYAWGQYHNGTEWETSDAEKGWELFDTLYRKEDFFHENVTGKQNVSGNPPCGQVDVIPPTADFSSYRLLLFLGYNRMTDELYEKLTSYVRGGGHVVLWLSHFDNAAQRGEPVRLYRDGDLSQLCGFKVTGRVPGAVRGLKFIQPGTFPEYDFPVRSVNRDPFYLGRCEQARIDATDPELRVVAAYSDYVLDTLENACSNPLLTERHLGKGAVFTVVSFTKPGADGLRKFAEMLVRTAVKAHRGTLEILAPDTVRWAVYPDGKCQKLYLLNSDPDLTQNILMQYQGIFSGEIRLSPCEFRALYLTDELLFLPSDSFCELSGNRGEEWSFETNRQNFEVENLSGRERKITINGCPVSLAAFQRISFFCPENLPDGKAEFFSTRYLEEPKMTMAERSTPY